MPRLDLNQLADLEALLREGSVARAAERLHVSAPAMSRRLAHLRHTFGDPLFVLAGRRLVPTERALALRERVTAVLDDARGVLAPQSVDFSRVERIVTIRANDGFVGAWAARLAARVAAEAPGIRLHFLPRAEKGMAALRNGEVDLDLGVLDAPAPEIHAQPLLRAPFVAAVRTGHPLAARRRIGVAQFVGYPHVSVSRHGRRTGPIDAALKALGARRQVALVAPGFLSAFEIAQHTDFIVTAPEPILRWNSAISRLRLFAMPVETPEVEISMCWHPRLHADPVHRWLREQVRAASVQATRQAAGPAASAA